MNAPDPGLFVAFFAGLLSFLSPCVLPLVPSYLGFVTGMNVAEMTDRRRVAMLQATLFVLGFTTIFLLLGAGATALGSALAAKKDLIGRIGGVVIIFFGLVSMGAIKIPALASLLNSITPEFLRRRL